MSAIINISYLTVLFPISNFDGEQVTMSISKLLARIVAPSEQDLNDQMTNESMLHDHTYGITSDPLTQFSCVLAGLLHDIDHPGELTTVVQPFQRFLFSRVSQLFSFPIDCLQAFQILNL